MITYERNVVLIVFSLIREKNILNATHDLNVMLMRMCLISDENCKYHTDTFLVHVGNDIYINLTPVQKRFVKHYI